MIMPGVQKPHWSPCFSQKPSWIGWSLPSLASPSIVMISAPSPCTASRVHDFIDRPLTMDGAGAALARVAADVRPGEAGQLADVVDEQQPRLDLVDCALRR